jgi:hypothetical protein
MAEPLHTIIIRPVPLGTGFDVEILPPVTDGPCHDREFATYKGAFGYASGLRLVTGWGVCDLSEDAR